MPVNQLPRLLLLIALFLCCRSSSASIVININYSGDAQYEAAFASAKLTWESLLIGYQNGVVKERTLLSTSKVGETLATININATIEVIDGVGGTLGSARPDEVALDELNFYLATDGSMKFDSADIGIMSPSRLSSLILHEMSHVLGFGTLWTLNGVYKAGSGEFTGAHATSVWQTQFGQSGTPDVEIGGEPGTAGSHWNENNGGVGLTGITDPSGRDMRDELMTGWLNQNSFISELTIASFEDIGFMTNPIALSNATAIPEPTTALMLASFVAFIATRRPPRSHR